MKKSVFIILLLTGLLFASAGVGIVYAQDNWHTANQVTVQWDAATTLENGDPIPAEPASVITYNVYSRNIATLVETLSVSGVSETQGTLTFNQEGSYLIGFQAIRVVEGVPDPILSAIVWSDDPLVCNNGETFGVRFFMLPGSPGGIRLQ